jgi:hypothetical protein
LIGPVRSIPGAFVQAGALTGGGQSHTATGAGSSSTTTPRRADATAVIGTALLASARGARHRRIAADLGCPAITVRRWLRAVRGGHAEWLRVAAIDRLAQLDRDIISTLAPAGSRIGDALNAVAAAALAHRAQLAPHVPIWDLVAAVTRWRLLPLPGD